LTGFTRNAKINLDNAPKVEHENFPKMEEQSEDKHCTFKGALNQPILKADIDLNKTR